MSNVTTGASRMPHDMNHLVYSCGEIGRLKVLSFQDVGAGESIEMDTIGSFRLSPLRRGLALDSCLEIFTFYVPYRHVYGDEWVDLMKEGPLGTSVLSTLPYTPKEYPSLAFLGTVDVPGSTCPRWLYEGYLNIYNNYFKLPRNADNTSSLDSLTEKDARYGLRCNHLKNIWSAALDPDTKVSHDIGLNGSSDETLDIMGLNIAYGRLQGQQERDAFMERYRDIIDDFGGSTTIDADQRPRLLMHTKFWSSGYDVDGTDQTSLGQFSGRVQQSFQHRVPRWYCPEHGVVMTLALARFPAIAEDEINYLVSNGSIGYDELAHDPLVVGNNIPRDVHAGEIVAGLSTRLLIPEGQWLRYRNSHVDPAYTEIGDFPFISTGNINNDADSISSISPSAYDGVFQSTALGHWNMQVKFNDVVYRRLPTALNSIIT